MIFNEFSGCKGFLKEPIFLKSSAQAGKLFPQTQKKRVPGALKTG